ncbi:hypothetical protein TCAL_00764 [Tigriopus californicus]|uniref:Methyltransferase-like protein 4 n=2 Tax=Tigriopus californicus TaxID=6832 RepID=A0A553PCF0_TIGCA|nr:hypothetical protein TCAL_00764 [Tigriopus californicus]|eukprot:TCALIF_00764-PA protein Name:"Similar to Mettl4 Methyltransferase-like protein 4 (Mus musculus)" AED:0.01 eAED:0.01 QI:0/-1/0/1/-1/1/1/0/361
MAIEYRVPQGWFLSHERFLNQTYSEVGLYSRAIFDLKTPFRMDLEARKWARTMEQKDPEQRTQQTPRRRRKPSTLNAEEKERNLLFSTFLDRLKETHSTLFDKEPSSSVIEENNRAVRDLVKDLPNFEVEKPLSMTNDQDASKIVRLADRKYILPPRCELILDDISAIAHLRRANRKFDIILADPPWENRHIKRKSEYAMMSNEDLARLPIQDLLHDHGYLIIWCTLSQRHQTELEGWLDRWDCELLTRWFWLKVTKCGEPVIDLEKAHKRPYEVILIARKRTSSNPIPSHFRKELIVCSVPSGHHSHKPPLSQILDEILPTSPSRKCLELFGRYLVPHWTTLGNECIKFQDIDYLFYSRV